MKLRVIVSVLMTIGVLLCYKVLLGDTFNWSAMSEYQIATAEAPYRFRVLLPLLANLMPYPALTAFAVFAWVFGAYAYLRCFFSQSATLAAVLGWSLLYNVVLWTPETMPFSLVQDALLVWGLTLLFRQHWKSFVIVLILAVMNRETGLILGLAAIGLARRGYVRAGWATMATAMASLLILTVRLWVGDNYTYWTLDRILERNLLTWYMGVCHAVCLLGYGWWLAFKGLPSLPEKVRAAAEYVPFYIISILIFGIWYEVRLITPLLPILVPAVLVGIFQPTVVREGVLQ